MTASERGNSRAHGSALNGGNSFANGPDMPKWAAHWQFILLREATVDRWKVEA